jgi:hypothetical protein
MSAAQSYEWLNWLVPHGYRESLRREGIKAFLRDLCELTQSAERNNGGISPGRAALSGLFYDAHWRVAQGERPHQVAITLSSVLFGAHRMLEQAQRTLQAFQEQLRLKADNRPGATAAGEVSAREQALELERDEWCERATDAEARVRELEYALANAQQARQLCDDENTQLELEIAARNRIIVEQQEALNEFVEPT